MMLLVLWSILRQRIRSQRKNRWRKIRMKQPGWWHVPVLSSVYTFQLFFLTFIPPCNSLLTHNNDFCASISLSSLTDTRVYVRAPRQGTDKTLRPELARPPLSAFEGDNWKYKMLVGRSQYLLDMEPTTLEWLKTIKQLLPPSMGSGQVHFL